MKDPMEAALEELRERIAQRLEAYAEPKFCTPATPEARLISATQLAAAGTVRRIPLNHLVRQFNPLEPT